MKAKKRVSHGIVALMIGSVVLLPSCGLIDWVKEKFNGDSKAPAAQESMDVAGASVNDGSAVLATIEGAPLITKNMLEVEKKKLIEANPQMEAMLALMDESQLNRNLVDGMASREIIRKYVKDKNIQESEKYQKDLQMALDQVRDLLNTRFFMEDFQAGVTEDEVAEFYKENRDSIPNLMLSRGGVESVGIPFASDDAAKAFMEKVRAAKNNIAVAAKVANLGDKIKDFNLVNAESLGMEPELRDKIVAIKKTPSLQTFKVGKETWVVAAKRIEEPTYRDLDSVKAEIKQLLEKDKTMKVVEQEVARLKGEYDVKLVEEEFAAPVDNAQAMQAAVQAQAEAQAVAQADEKEAQAPQKTAVA
jgi:hypothetical protein